MKAGLGYRANGPGVGIRWRSPTTLLLGAGLLLGAAAANPAAAQPPDHVDLGSVDRRVERMEPGQGPPGTIVVLESDGLPAVTPIRIGIGASRFGFEEVGQELTDAQGHFAGSYLVPEWATNDRSHVFIVFDYYFRPLAYSEVFHVTDESGRISRRGVIEEATATCPLLRGDDDHLYALLGDLEGHGIDAQVVVEGRIADMSPCMQGTALEILSISGG